MNKLYLGLLAGALLLSGCQGQLTSATSTAGAAGATPTLGSPAASTSAVATTIPTPPSDKSTVAGVLKSGLSTATPANGMVLYLAAILPESRGTPFLASFDRVNSPEAFTDAAGRFVFSNIAPGSYGLVLDRVVQSFLLGDPKHAKPDFIIDAKAGQIVDLGDLDYDSLPGQSP